MKFSLKQFVVSDAQGVQASQGSALLISLLLMTFIMIFGLGLASLIIDAIKVERNIVDAGKAYFASESGVELALYYRENRLPGYEVPEVDSVVDLSNGTTVSYNMVATSAVVPCAHRESEWRELQIQESVSLPLYRYDPDEASGRADLADFELLFQVDRLEDWNQVNGEVLRWKILGFDSTNDQTEAISGLLDYDVSGVSSNVLNSATTASFHDGVSGSTFVQSMISVSTFLQNHYFNTLILTNVLDLAAQDPAVQGADQNVLGVRLETSESDPSPCEYTLIESDGESDGIQQNIDVQVRLDSFLPVFHFVLYQTDGS